MYEFKLAISNTTQMALMQHSYFYPLVIAALSLCLFFRALHRSMLSTGGWLCRADYWSKSTDPGPYSRPDTERLDSPFWGLAIASFSSRRGCDSKDYIVHRSPYLRLADKSLSPLIELNRHLSSTYSYSGFDNYFWLIRTLTRSSHLKHLSAMIAPTSTMAPKLPFWNVSQRGFQRLFKIVDEPDEPVVNFPLVLAPSDPWGQAVRQELAPRPSDDIYQSSIRKLLAMNVRRKVQAENVLTVNEYKIHRS
jgi:hypothetical protein